MTLDSCKFHCWGLENNNKYKIIINYKIIIKYNESYIFSKHFIILYCWIDQSCILFVSFVLGLTSLLTSEVISQRCLLVAVVLWPMCCHTEMPCRRHRTWHPTPSQYTDTGLTCCCAIHWCDTSQWNTQLPILISWVWPDREILPRPSTHTR